VHSHEGRLWKGFCQQGWRPARFVPADERCQCFLSQNNKPAASCYTKSKTNQCCPRRRSAMTNTPEKSGRPGRQSAVFRGRARDMATIAAVAVGVVVVLVIAGQTSWTGGVFAIVAMLTFCTVWYYGTVDPAA